MRLQADMPLSDVFKYISYDEKFQDLTFHIALCYSTTRSSDELLLYTPIAHKSPGNIYGNSI